MKREPFIPKLLSLHEVEVITGAGKDNTISSYCNSFEVAFDEDAVGTLTFDEHVLRPGQTKIFWNDPMVLDVKEYSYKFSSSATTERAYVTRKFLRYPTAEEIEKLKKRNS